MSYYYSTAYSAGQNASWYSRVDTSTAGTCGVVSSQGSNQTCGSAAGATGMCYSHESEIRKEIAKAKSASSGYSYGSGSGYSYGGGYGYSYGGYR